MPLYAQDANLTISGALPNGAASTTPSAGIDTQNSSLGEGAQLAEYLLTAPALTTGQLADTATMTYDVIVSANSNLSSPVVIYKSVLVQTGAGGVGAAAATARFRLPLSPGGIGATNRYVGFKSTNSGAGNASSLSATLAMVF